MNTVSAIDQLIIKYKPTISQTSAIASGKISKSDLRQQQMQPLSKVLVSKVSKLAGISLVEVNQIATGAHVLQLANNVSESQLQQIIQNIQADVTVDYVVEMRTAHTFDASIPVLNESQWDMQLVSTNSNPTFTDWQGDNLEGAWTAESYLMNITYPGSSVVVGVVDTGYTPHQNFVDNNGLWHLVGYSESTPSSGYQFLPVASGGYVPNALDTGDYCSSPFESSDWHGTHVTGVIIAQGYNGESGIKGGAFGAMVMPARVFSTCGSGGAISDIENAMLWLAGYSVPNPSGGIINGSITPTNVISLSLGTAFGGCDRSMQDTINTITNNGTNGIIIVASAGNAAQNVSNVEPAGCQNVISVAAKGPNNNLSFYSNYGNTTITASGGDTGSSPTYIGYESNVLSTIWSSTTVYESPGNGGYGTYIGYEGTSQAAPHVSAIVADMIGALKANRESWDYTTMVYMLQQTARNLSSACNTDVWHAGSGGCVNVKSSLNAESAIVLAITNPPTPQPPSSSSGGGGCTVANGGDDCSLLILLFSGIFVYIWRRARVDRVRSCSNVVNKRSK